jgi:hypothetical protein
MFIEFEGAAMDVDDMTGERDYAPRGKVCVNTDNIGAFYDHTLLLLGHKIRVMEDYEEIRNRIAPTVKWQRFQARE